MTDDLHCPKCGTAALAFYEEEDQTGDETIYIFGYLCKDCKHTNMKQYGGS